jgi:hypothetical protein
MPRTRSAVTGIGCDGGGWSNRGARTTSMRPSSYSFANRTRLLDVSSITERRDEDRAEGGRPGRPRSALRKAYFGFEPVGGSPPPAFPSSWSSVASMRTGAVP